MATIDAVTGSQTTPIAQPPTPAPEPPPAPEQASPPPEVAQLNASGTNATPPPDAQNTIDFLA